MEKIKKAFWFSLGIIFLGIAYLGTFVPGLPWSTPSIIAAWCFSKSSERFHNYMLNHRLFGPFIINWRDRRVYPSKIKLVMFVCMDMSLVTIWFATHNLKLVIGLTVLFALIMFWAMRYPGSVDEYERRKQAGEKIGWFK